MRKLLLLVVVILSMVVTVGAAFGSAADLKVQGGTIQAGADYDVKMYDVAEVEGWGLETDDGLVYFVRMGFHGVQPPSGGNNELTFFVQITDKDHNVIATSSKQVVFPVQQVTDYNLSGQVFTFNTPVAACDIYDIHVFVEGSANSGETTPICPELP